MIAEFDIDTDPLFLEQREHEAPAITDWEIYIEALLAEEEDPFGGGDQN